MCDGEKHCEHGEDELNCGKYAEMQKTTLCTFYGRLEKLNHSSLKGVPQQENWHK